MRSLSLLVLASWSTCIQAQAYIPLLDTSATWQDHFVGGDPGPNTTTFECYVYYLAGDTLLNTTAYKILRKSGISSYGQSVPPYLSYTNLYSAELVAFLREDTTARRVFILDPAWSATQEFLLYDFSGELGPYPPTYRYGNGSPELEVIAVDSVVLIDGPHRRITLDHGDQIIEGIGSVSGFLPGQIYALFNWVAELICHGLDSTYNYSILSWVSGCECGYNVGIPTAVIHDLKVGPSPTTDLCHLQGAPPNAPYRVRSMDGRIVRSGTCTNNGSATVDLAGLSAAMYVIEVIDAARMFQAKVIKE